MSTSTNPTQGRIDAQAQPMTCEASSAAVPPSENAQAWRFGVPAIRSALVLLVVLLIAWLMDGWTRVGHALRHRNDQPRTNAFMNRAIRRWGVWTWWVTRVGLRLKVVVRGTPPVTGRYLILSNHQSSIDIPALISVFRAMNLKFVAMEELRYGKPGVSFALRNGGFAFVAKRNLGEDLAALDQFGRQLHLFDGSPVIFPEGRRTDDGSILPFHFAGTETVRRASGLPLLLVTLDGLVNARTIKELPLLVGTTITFRISEPIRVDETKHNPRSVLGRTEETIRRNLDEIRATTASWPEWRRSADSEA